MSKMKATTYLTDEQAKDLTDLCAVKGLSVSKLLEQLVLADIETNQEKIQRLRELRE